MNAIIIFIAGGSVGTLLALLIAGSAHLEDRNTIATLRRRCERLERVHELDRKAADIRGAELIRISKENHDLKRKEA